MLPPLVLCFVYPATTSPHIISDHPVYVQIKRQRLAIKNGGRQRQRERFRGCINGSEEWIGGRAERVFFCFIMAYIGKTRAREWDDE